MITDVLCALLILFMTCADTAAVSRVYSEGCLLIEKKAETIRRETESALERIGVCEICEEETEEDPGSYPDSSSLP